MYQLSHSKRDVQRFFSETSNQREISQDYKVPELNLPVIKDYSNVDKSVEELPSPVDEPETDTETEVSTEPETEVSTETEPEVSTETEPEVSTEPEPEVSTETEPEVSTEPETELSTEPEAEVSTEPESEVSTEPEAEVSTEPEAEVSTEPETEVSTEPETEVSTETEPEVSTEPEEEVSTETEPEVSTETEVSTESVEEPDDFQPVEEPPKEESKPPVEPMEDVPITTYDYNGDTFFVDNRTSLQRTFDFPDGSYPINLCIYTCVRNGCCPYLLYLTVYDAAKGALVFPTGETVDVGPEDSEDDIRERTIESFQNALFGIFPPSDSEKSIEEEPTDIYNPHLFQGLFLDENVVSMVYDSTRVSVPLATDKEYFWVTPYEITTLYQYRNVPIDPSVIDFFHSVSSASGFIDKSFHHLKRISDSAFVPSPYVLFPCSPSSPGILSIFGSSTQYTNPIQLPEEEVNLLIPTVDHPSVGNVPLFSTKPLDPSVPHIQRYAVFVDIEGMEPFFIDEETPEIIDHLYDLYQTRQYSSINFIEKNTEYWCVKSPLYFTEIHDHQLQTVPINTFQEIDAPNVPTAAPLPKDVDTLSNEGSDAASDEGDEHSDDGSIGSNEGSERASDQESDNGDLDDFHRGYQEGLLAGIKQKAIEAR